MVIGRYMALTAALPCSLRLLSLSLRSEGERSSNSPQPELGDNPLIAPLMSFLLTSLHQDLSLIDVVSREVILTNELLVAKDGGQTRPAAEEGQDADDDDEGRVVYVEIVREPGDKVGVTCGLGWSEGGRGRKGRGKEGEGGRERGKEGGRERYGGREGRKGDEGKGGERDEGREREGRRRGREGRGEGKGEKMGLLL